MESVEKETIDTSSLSTSRMEKGAALTLFTKEQLLLGSPENKVEKEHFLEVIAIAVAKILAERRPEAKNLSKLLPAHHKHENSAIEQTPAITFILKPYPYQAGIDPVYICDLLQDSGQILS